MKIVKVDLDSLRRERRRSAKFVLVFFTLVAIAWPIASVEFFTTSADVPSDLDFDSYHTEIRVDKQGHVRVKETVEVNFARPQTYVRSVGELAATDNNARYYSYSLGAKIDGEEVSVKDGYVGVGGHYYRIGDDLTGAHTIEFSYEVPNGIIYDKGKPMFRSRLLPRYSLSEVKQFQADLYFETTPLVQDAVCWTSDGSKPKNEADKCEVEAVDANHLRIVEDSPAYLRPVRLVLPLEAGAYDTASLPWGGYWDNVLGRSWLTPVLTVSGAGLIIAFAPRLLRRRSDRQWQQVVGASFIASILLIWLLLSFVPSILLLLPAAILWTGLDPWLRSSERRMVLSEEQVLALQRESEDG